MSRTLRTFAALALTVLFLASAVPAAAAPLPGQAGSGSLWSSAWQWLVGLFLPDEAGVGIVPNGGALRPTPPGPNGDAGGTIDPNGLIVPGVSPDRRQELSRFH